MSSTFLSSFRALVWRTENDSWGWEAIRWYILRISNEQNYCFGKSVQNSASNWISLWADTPAWRLSVGLFHSIKESGRSSGGCLALPPIQNGSAVFSIIPLNPQFTRILKGSSSQRRVNIEVFFHLLLLQKLLSWERQLFNEVTWLWLVQLVTSGSLAGGDITRDKESF